MEQTKKMKNLLEQFLHYITVERNFSPRTVTAYRQDLSGFVAFLDTLGKQDLKQITKDDIRLFLTHLAKTGIRKPNAPISYSRKLSSIKSFFKYLVREDMLVASPAAFIETPKLPHKEPSYLTQEEFRILLGTVRRVATPYYFARDLAIITTFLGTGVRLSELVGLTLKSISLDGEQPTIKVRGKGNKERIIPLNDEVVAVLQKYLKSRPEVATNHLFVSRLGNQLCTGSVYHLIKHYLKESGIKKDKVGVHSLRHTFGVSLLNNNVNLVVIQELLGHTKLETTRRYLHINSVDLRNAVNGLVLTKQP